MAFTGITASEADIDSRAGANADDNFTDTMKTQHLLAAESNLNRDAMFDCTAAFATWDVKSKSTITDVTACSVAIDMINYNRAAIGGNEAFDRVQVLYDRVAKGTKALADKNKTTKLTGFST